MVDQDGLCSMQKKKKKLEDVKDWSMREVEERERKEKKDVVLARKLSWDVEEW
jgi:hypothetical protein